jgi:hypothetical protein
MARPTNPAKREADLKVRLKLFTTNLTTYAYAIMGASFVDPYIKGAGFKTASYVGLALALVLHTLAWYIAPHGEKP